MRVHALIDGLIGGGAEMLLAEFASAAPSAGIELSVAALNDSAGRPAAARLAERGVDPSFVPITSIVHPRDLRRVRDHLAAVRPDLLHTHLGNADLMGGVAARSLGIPAVSTIHADWWKGDLRKRTRLHLMALARRFCMARVLAVSESARRAYLAERWDRPAHVQIVHNGIAARPAPGAGARVRAELGIPADSLVLTMMSTLRPEKGFDVAIEVTRRLAATRPELRLLIAGGGPYEEGVRRLAAGLPCHAVVAGHRDDVMEVLDASDVLFQPSRYDAFPTTLLEAMAAGLPIVATGVGGIPEVVTDGQTGVVVEPPPDPDRFIAALAPLLDDGDRRIRLAQAAQARFEAEFTAEQWARRLRVVYDDVLSSRPASRPILSGR